MQYLQVVGIVELDLLQWGQRKMRGSDRPGRELLRMGAGGTTVTIKELSQLYYLNREIEQEKDRLRQLEEAATSTTPKITGLPHVAGIADKTAIAAQIADTRMAIQAKIDLSVVEYNRLLLYINGIEDSFTRQIISLRFVNGLSWRQVAAHIGGGNTEDGVKKACYRHIRQSCPECPEKINYNIK